MTARLLLEYDGSGFAGWATQPRQRTVQQPAQSGVAVAALLRRGLVPGDDQGIQIAAGHLRERVEHPQKIFDSVLSWAWTSSPMIVSQVLVIRQLSVVSCIRFDSFLQLTTDY